MLKRICLAFFVFGLLAGCSSGSDSSSYEKGENSESYDQAAVDVTMETANNSKSVSGQQQDNSDAIQSRMIIYNAELQLEVENFLDIKQSLENLVAQLGGYVVQSNVYADGEDYLEGTLRVRIPQPKFQEFINKAEQLSVKVHRHTVTGEDVTEEFVDLESRLNSMQVVEERLLSFLRDAEKTEDLLKISNDLARVQQDIEQIKGRMKYLQNQTSFSTVTISMFEHKVVVPNIEKNEFNTWEKTKKQFYNSINGLLSFFSAVVVFLLGNSPVIVLLVIILATLYYILRRTKKKPKQDNN
ncbi:DUF4349 domain-containing protein [Bacillus sp. HMF5848]|uniref:DUF4349 domain-containing protein n=1 Tax=Bacillus sp. HMF5848 TaxID=2495421 RepID=UPI000F78319C|nr:DUF4349 domain-containing protein [Bacillus sp. HMF5848]RSK26765.1 DUF4349 domain-containing protein [Bacillus sp. HMF5848]